MTTKITNRFSSRHWRVALLGVALGAATVPFLLAMPRAEAKKRDDTVPKLQLWPGQRVTVVLPTTLGADWNNDPQLGTAILPVIAPELQNALIRTQKFSLTLPYRFDPILLRAQQERRVAPSDLDVYLGAPTIQSVQPVMGKFSFDQPFMVVETKLEALTISGTPKQPLVSVKVSGTMYEGSTVVRRAVVTSRSFGGKTPEARLMAAAAQAFDDLADQFVTAPPSFELPLPIVPTPTPAPAKTASGKATKPDANTKPAVAPVSPIK